VGEDEFGAEVKGEIPGVLYCQGGAFGEIDGQEDFVKRIHDRLSIRIRRSGIAKLAGKALSRRPGSLLASGGFEVEQCLAGQLRNHRVRVAEQPDERADPGEFFGVDTDYGNRVRHRGKSFNYLFGCNRRKYLLLENFVLLPIRVSAKKSGRGENFQAGL